MDLLNTLAKLKPYFNGFVLLTLGYSIGVLFTASTYEKKLKNICDKLSKDLKRINKMQDKVNEGMGK